MVKITGHVLVKNEENFVWFAIQSVIDKVEQLIVFDTGSTDATVEIIKTIKSPKIIFEEKGPVDFNRYIVLRRELVERTKTDWFLQVDGDEVWPDESIKALANLIESAPPETYAIVNRTRNCVGDIYHYLPEETGQYELLGRKGHLNIRAVKKTSDLKVELAPPFNTYTETYINKYGSIPTQDKNLLFLDKYLWHFTHLHRSTVDDHGKARYDLGIAFPPQTEYPEVFYKERPSIVPDPWVKAKMIDWLKAAIQTPIKRVKRRLISK
jgi:glycosyltransferase involved in cell wall biosynthesis